MTQDPARASAHRHPGELTPEQRTGRERAVRMMMLGAIVAVLAPLGGFLAGSMVGPSQQLGEYEAMFVWMFAGLFVGGIGAVGVLLGVLRWSHSTRHLPPTS